MRYRDRRSSETRSVIQGSKYTEPVSPEVQVVRGRLCILTSLKDGQKFQFDSMTMADVFLDRAHGYVNTCANKGHNAAKIDIYGNIEEFSIELGESTRIAVPRRLSSEQPCWKCKNCYGDCSWSSSFEPVVGWDAIQTILGNDISYRIISCPEFDADGT